MSNDIGKIASEFLREYMSNNASVEFPKVVCPSRAHDIVEDSHETAAEFVDKIRQLKSRGLIDPSTSERINVTETGLVNILRVVKKGRPIQPAFLVGFRRDGRAVWGYQNRLALAMSPEKADEYLERLKEFGFECFVLPAPEVKHSSL